jgi:hypothetical protein
MVLSDHQQSPTRHTPYYLFVIIATMHGAHQYRKHTIFLIDEESVKLGQF